MRKFSDIVSSEDTTLTNEGEYFITNFLNSLNQLLLTPECQGMGIMETAKFGKCLLKYITKIFISKIDSKRTVPGIGNMTDDEFKIFIRSKQINEPLSIAEFERYSHIPLDLDLEEIDFKDNRKSRTKTQRLDSFNIY